MTRPKAADRVLNLLGLFSAIAGCLLAPLSLYADRLQPETAQAFEQYVAASEARIDAANRSAAFLSIDMLPEPSRRQAYAALESGQILVQPWQGAASGAIEIPGGLIHDWTGIVFVPGISLSQVLALLQDYDHAADRYAPGVQQSKLLARAGNDFRVSLRLKETRVLTVVFDTEYDVHYEKFDALRAFSRSRSTRIVEVENPGTPRERERPAGDDQGLLWRLNSYWRFDQAHGGVFIECHAISLTRGIPAALAWMIRPFLSAIPQDSLRDTLEATRRALTLGFSNRSPIQPEARLMPEPQATPLATIGTQAFPTNPAVPLAQPPSSDLPADFRDAVRVQTSLLAALERRALLWLAARLPRHVTPDHLTLLGFLAMLLAGASYALAQRHPAGLLFAAAFLALNWLGDSLDGTVARMRRCERPRYGFYVDHVIDAFGTAALLVGLAASSYMDWRIAAALLVAFQLLSIESYLASYSLGVFRLSFARFGPTELRILLIAANIAVWCRPQLAALGTPWRLFDFAGTIGAAAMAGATAIASVAHAARLYHEEPSHR